MTTKKSDSKSVFIPLDNARDSARVRSSVLPVGMILALVVVVLPLFLTYSLATTSEYVVVATFLMLITAVVILRWPFVGLNILMLILYVRPEESIEEIRGLRLFFVISLLTLFSLLTKHFVDGVPLRRNPTMIAVALFCLSVVLSSTINGGSFSVVSVDMLNIVAFMFIIIDQIDSESKYKFLVRNLMYCTFIVSVYSIYLFYSGASMNQHGVYRSIGTGIFSDPNDLSSAIIPGFALSLSCVKRRDLSSIWNLLIACVCLYAIVLTSSRGAVLGLVSIFVTFMFVSGKIKKRGIVPAIILMVLILVLAPTRMTNIDAGEESANSRLQFWMTGIYSFMSQPLLGIGHGGFPDINDGFTAHNSFVLCFTEVGFIGYFFWMSCIYFAYRAILINRKSSGDYVNGVLMAVNGFLTCSFFLSKTYNLVLMMILGISSGCMTDLGAKELMSLFNNREFWRVSLISVFSIVLIYLMSRFLA